MTKSDNLDSFFKENKRLLREYLEIRAEVYRLRFIRVFSKLAANFIWMIISMFLIALLLIFLGLVTGFYFSEVTGSYSKGFGIATIILILVIFLISMLRKVLFVNPVIRAVIRRTGERSVDEYEDSITK